MPCGATPRCVKRPVWSDRGARAADGRRSRDRPLVRGHCGDASHVFRELFEQRVACESLLLKANMVISGYDCPEQAGVQDVAERTLRSLRQTVPAAVPGVVFLSGGQSDQRASAHLDAMSRVEGLPWEISFSYGRALLGLSLETWRGKQSNLAAAQAAVRHRARLTGAARRGEYSEEMERERDQVAAAS